MSSSRSEYRDAHTSGRIKLKETKSDRAERVYRREQRRIRHEQRRIDRANGYAVSPPRAARSESITPPRHQPKASALPDDEEAEDTSGGYAWMGGLARAAKEQMKRMEEMERMAWLAQEEMSRGNPFGSVNFGFAQPTPDVRIPRRHARAAGPGENSRTRGSRRDASREVELEGGTVPDPGRMGEEEYAEWVRGGMYRLKNRAEVERQERIRQERLERERLREVEEEKARKAEAKRLEKLRKEKGRVEEERRSAQRERYRSRWKTIVEVGGEIEESELAFVDIPWPIYRPPKRSLELDHFEVETVRTFLLALAADTSDQDTELKKVIREAIRSFHPDRFFGRILPRVREADRETVKDAVERTTRILNDLAAEKRTR